MLKLGLLGLGNQMQENLLPAILENGNIEISTIKSRDLTKAQGIAKKYNFKNIAKTDDELFSSIDALIVSATPNVHLEYIEKSSKNNKAIFVEKPPFYSLKQYEKMVNLIEKYQTIISFGFNFKYSDFYKLLLQKTNDFDQTNFIKIKSYAAKPNSPFWDCKNIIDSSLLAIHIHAIELLCYSINSTIVDIKKELCWINDTKFVLTILVKFQNQKIGLLELSNASNKFEFSIECINDKEIIRCEDFNKIEFIKTVANKNLTKVAKKSYISYDVPFLNSGFGRTGYKNEIEDFINRIKTKQNNLREIKNLKNVYKIIEETIKWRNVNYLEQLCIC